VREIFDLNVCEASALAGAIVEYQEGVVSQPQAALPAPPPKSAEIVAATKSALRPVSIRSLTKDARLTSSDAMVEHLMNLFAKLTVSPKHTRQSELSSHTPSSQAKSLKSELRVLGTFFKLENGSGNCFLSADDRQSLPSQQSLRHERFLVGPMMSIIRRKLTGLLSPDCVLVNCEEYGWIPQRSASRVCEFICPDLLVAPLCAMEMKPAYNNAPCQNELYGVLKSFSLRRCVAMVMDGKVVITDEGLGNFKKYLEHLSCADGYGELEMKGFMFDAERGVMMKAFGGHIMEIREFGFNEPGGEEYFRQFFSNCQGKDEFFRQAAHVCFGDQLDIIGQGAIGRVFERRDGAVAKVVYGEDNVIKLQREYDYLTNLAIHPSYQQFSNFVAHALPNSFCVFEDATIGVFSMTPIGKPMKSIDDFRKKDVIAILRILFLLHSNHIFHGDARFQNVVKQNNNFVWVDFALAHTTPGGWVYAEKDVKAFLQSIDLYYSNSQLVDQYMKALTHQCQDINELLNSGLNMDDHQGK